jgi:hypothetical protein
VPQPKTIRQIVDIRIYRIIEYNQSEVDRFLCIFFFSYGFSQSAELRECPISQNARRSRHFSFLVRRRRGVNARRALALGCNAAKSDGANAEMGQGFQGNNRYIGKSIRCQQ